MTAHQTASPSVAYALTSKQLFGPFFAGSSWDTWRATLKAAFAEPLTATELETFHEVAGRDPPTHRVKELVAIVGRGGGKDSTASFIASYIAMSFDPKTAKLRPGELVYVNCLAVDKDQAAIVFEYIRALFEIVPTLKAMVREITSDSITLKNRVVIKVTTNSYRSIRGRGVLAAIFDEAAFWRSDESQNPDTEVHLAIAPGLARVQGSMLILISSAHRTFGLLYERWKDFFGQPDDDVLVVRGTTTQFNPSFDQRVIDRAIAKDPQRYNAEYNSAWRDDLSTFLTREQLDAVTEPRVTVRPPIEGVVYRSFVDPSGGRADAFTMSIAHRETRTTTTGDSEASWSIISMRVTAAIRAKLSRRSQRYYGAILISTVTGDAYAAEWVVEAFRKCGIEYRKSKLDRSEIYLGFLPLVTAGELLLIDHPRAIAQFAGLVRRTFPSGKDRIDHEINGHDDLANSIAGAAVLASIDREQKIPLVAPLVFGTPRNIPGGTVGQSEHTPQDQSQNRGCTDSTTLYYEWMANGGGGNRFGGT
jgi:hypothetical protein